MLYRLLPKHLDMQIALVCALVLICSMPWYIIHEANQEFDTFLDNIKKQSRVLANNVAISSIEYIKKNDYIGLKEMLMRSILFPDVVDIQIINNSGHILSSAYKYKKNSSHNEIVVPVSKIRKTIITDDLIIIWTPIRSKTRLGWVKLNYTLESANNQKSERIQDYIKDASLVSLILILFLIFSMRRPLRMISEAANFSSRLENRTGEQIPITNQSIELDKLYQALNKASSNLAEQEATIKKVVGDLETQKLALDEHSIVSISDINGKITYANDKLLGSTGYKFEELIGKEYRIFKSSFHDTVFFKNIWGTIKSGNIWHGDIVNLNKRKFKVWMQTTIVPFLDDRGKPYEYVTIQTDITALKETEAQLAEKNTTLQDLTNELEYKVKSRTAELQKVNTELIQLNNTKSDFVSVVSHELRTPLTSIKSFSEILADDIDELDSETRHHYISIINEESDRLGNLINNVLDLQKIDSGKMSWNKEKTDLKKLASTSIELFSKLYSEKGLELILEVADEDLFSEVDSDKIKQVLSNLLSNAYKFTDTGEVTLKLKKVIPHPTALILDNDDNNSKIVEQLLKKMDVKCISCSQADKALTYLKDRKRKIDLIITDVSMPEMDGIELIKSIRKINKNIPIMVISTTQNNIILKSLLDYVVTAFIDKEIDPTKFNNAIDKIFGGINQKKNKYNSIEISLHDSGSGIPEDELDKVFDRFHQVDNSETREKGGSGLGLAICQDIIQQHDGQLWVKSTYGKGCVFTFNLPLISNKKRPIGEILVEAGIATQEEINNALSKQQ